MESKNNGFIQIIIILIVVAAIGVFVIVKHGDLKQLIKIGTPVPTATADPTSDWKLYEGKYFSFKYPNDWHLQVKTSGDACVSQSDPMLPTISQSFCVFRFLNSEGLDVKTWYEKTQKVSRTLVDKQLTNIDFSSLSAFQTAITSPISGYMHSDIFIAKDNYIYDLVETYSNKTFFDQIVSTFKLNDQPQITHIPVPSGTVPY